MSVDELVMDSLRLPRAISADLLCPICKYSLIIRPGGDCACANPECSTTFPIVDGCPVLINEANSVFSIDDYVARNITTMDMREIGEVQESMFGKVKRWVARLTPSISRSVNTFPPKKALEEVLANVGRTPRILVIGSGDAAITLEGACELIYSDVAIGPLTQLVCDAHDIPFPTGYFDAVMAVAVFEHVADPYRCVNEVRRVLTDDGFVYSITPFMQQVHMGRFDFTRFTYLGHRRLFRWFTEVRSGVANAQGMVLDWSIERFVSGFSDNARIHSVLRSLSRFLAFPFLFFDQILARKAGSFDAASGYYFFGRKSDHALSDRDLIKGYRGMVHVDHS